MKETGKMHKGRPEWADKGEGLIRIGKIVRTHGISGEVELQFYDDAFDRGDAEFFVLETEGIFVPFFWEEYRFKNNRAIILKLEDYDSDSEAKRLVGLTAWYPAEALPPDEEQMLTSVKGLYGFTLEGADGKKVGRIDSIDDSTNNILLYVVNDDGKEIILPYHDDLLHHFDYSKRILGITIPEGLLNAND